MSLDALKGQATARQTLERALRSGKVHHAYRFFGPEGVGKEFAARLLARALVCPHDPLGCGACSACDRALRDSPQEPQVPLHPDILMVARGLYPNLGKSEATGISVEQIRKIILPRVGYPPHEGQALVIIIRDADELTVSAANALLKTLEEPQPKTHFILLSDKPGKFLDTIVSRTLALRFGRLPQENLREILQAQGHESGIAEGARGSVAEALRASEGGGGQAREEFVQAADAALRAGSKTACLKFAEARPSARNELLFALSHLASVYQERAKTEIHAGGRSLKWNQSYDLVMSASKKVERNGSPALVIEAMMLQLLEFQ